MKDKQILIEQLNQLFPKTWRDKHLKDKFLNILVQTPEYPLSRKEMANELNISEKRIERLFKEIGYNG